MIPARPVNHGGELSDVPASEQRRRARGPARRRGQLHIIEYEQNRIGTIRLSAQSVSPLANPAVAVAVAASMPMTNDTAVPDPRRNDGCSSAFIGPYVGCETPRRTENATGFRFLIWRSRIASVSRAVTEGLELTLGANIQPLFGSAMERSERERSESCLPPPVPCRLESRRVT